MQIHYLNKRLEKELTLGKKMQAEHGARRAKLLQQRLAEISAAPSLAVLRMIPGPRCHELKGDRKGQLSVDLDHPYRLIFEPAHESSPKNETGGLDWQKVTNVKIVEITDTHE